MMTMEQAKAGAKNPFGKESTGEQAPLETYGGKLTEEELEQVSGGVSHKSPRRF